MPWDRTPKFLSGVESVFGVGMSGMRLPGDPCPLSSVSPESPVLQVVSWAVLVPHRLWSRQQPVPGEPEGPRGLGTQDCQSHGEPWRWKGEVPWAGIWGR